MKTLLHIPHASLNVPDSFYDGLLIPREEFRRYNLKMSDVGVDELFRDVRGERVRSCYSWLFCDVERFRDDEKETMSRFGEGVVYTKLYDGKDFHAHGDGYKKSVLDYYDWYHAELDRVTEYLLQKDGELLILDCHSFSDEMASYFFKPPFPDVCIGVEKDYYDRGIIDGIVSEVLKRGYSCMINHPYSGSLVPNTVMSGRTAGKVVSVMIEVNKRIYL